MDGSRIGVDDPGWAAAVRAALWQSGPGLLRPGKRRSGNVLVMLRTLMLAFFAALVLIGVVALIAHSGGDEAAAAAMSPAAVVSIVAVVALATTTASTAVSRKPLPCDPGGLLGGYRARFFLRIALAETVTLVAFAGTFLCRESWVYFVGAAVTAGQYFAVSPSRRNLVALQPEPPVERTRYLPRV